MADLANNIERGLNRNNQIVEKFVAQLEKQLAQGVADANSKRDFERKFGPTGGHATKTDTDAIKSDTSAILSAVNNSARTASSTGSGQTVTESRLNELFGKAVQSASAKQVSSTGVSGKTDDATTSAKMTPTEERLTELFGKAEKRDRESSDKLDELFGKTNTQLTGINTNIEDNKKHIISLKKFDLGGMIMGFLASPVGLMMLSFVGGFAWGWLNTQGWFQTIKKAFGFIGDLLKNPTVQKILAGGFIAGLVNHLTGGLLFKLVGPLIGLVAKGVGALLFKGLPALLKFVPTLAKGLMSAMTSPVGLVAMALAGGIAAGVALDKWIASRGNAEAEKELKKNDDATKFESNAANRKSNEEQAASLNQALNGDETQIEITDREGNIKSVVGHYDESSNFVVTGTYDQAGKKTTLATSYTIPKANLESMNATVVDYSEILISGGASLTKVDWQALPENLKAEFATYIDENFSGQFSEDVSGSDIIRYLIAIQACFHKEGEGLDSFKTGSNTAPWYKFWVPAERTHVIGGAEWQMTFIVKALSSWCKTLGITPPGNLINLQEDRVLVNYTSNLSDYDGAFSEFLSKLVPKSEHTWFQTLFADKVVIRTKELRTNPGMGMYGGGMYEETVEHKVFNWLGVLYGILEYWCEQFITFLNKEKHTDFKQNVMDDSELEDAMSKGIVSKANAMAIRGRQSARLNTSYQSGDYRKSTRDRILELYKKDRDTGGLGITKEELDERERLEKQYREYGGEHSSNDGVTLKQLLEEIREVKECTNRAVDNSAAAKENSETTVGLGAGTLVEMKRGCQRNALTTAEKPKYRN